MKTVIRRGVFETNSSSTHSLSLRPVRGTKNNEIDSDASFEIRSPLAKAVTMLGLIDNADDCFYRPYHIRDEYNDKVEDVKKDTIDRIRKINPSLLENVELEGISSADILDILMELDDLDSFYVASDFEDFDEYIDKKLAFDYYFYDDLKEKLTALKVKELIFEEYAKITNKSIEDAREEIDFEAFSYVELKDALADEKNAKEKVEKLMQRDYRFRSAYEKCTSCDVMEFSKKYLYENYLEFKNEPGRTYCCHRYFCEGCLDDCNCGFETYYDILSELEIGYADDEATLRKKVRRYLSKEFKLVAKETYGYSTPMKTGEIY